MAGDKKRPSVKARHAKEAAGRGSRRKQRSGNGAMRAESTAYGNRAIRHNQHGPGGISITVQIPPLRRQKTDKPVNKLASTKQRLLRPVLALPILLLVGSAVFLAPAAKPQKTEDNKVAAAERTEPDYKPLLPEAETASATRYDAKRNLVSYNSTFSGVRLTVSQQPVPENFSKDPAAIMKMADSIKAKQIIETAKGNLHVATNETAGDQLAVIADKGLLIFVHTDKKLDDISWKAFIELLEAKTWHETPKEQ